jgi:RNA polymerase sigma factor (sigma-70 family)
VVPFVFENRPSQAYNGFSGRLNAMGGPDMSDATDELWRLVERCNGGEEKAWHEFWSRYHNKISGAVRKLCYSAPGEIEDIVQEVFEHLLTALRSYDPSRSIEAYIVDIARKVAISYIRKESAKKRKPLSTADCPVDPPPCPNPEGTLIQAQEKELLRKSLNELPEDCRRLIAMKYDEGLSYKEIATWTGVKEVTLRTQMSRCLSTAGKISQRLSAPTRRTHHE